MRYNHPGSKYKSIFYFFNDQLDYAFAQYFVESDTINGNINKFLTNLLMAPFTKKLSYNNADEWMEKLLKILLGILKDE